MAKKKKTSLKPVARGFATTSVPKKVIPVEEQPDEPNPDDGIVTQTIAEQTEPGHPRESSAGIDNHSGALDWDSEEQSLQSLVNKFQEKVEKDVVRTVKVFCMCSRTVEAQAPHSYLFDRESRRIDDFQRLCLALNWIQPLSIASSSW